MKGRPCCPHYSSAALASPEGCLAGVQAEGTESMGTQAQSSRQIALRCLWIVCYKVIAPVLAFEAKKKKKQKINLISRQIWQKCLLFLIFLSLEFSTAQSAMSDYRRANIVFPWEQWKAIGRGSWSLPTTGILFHSFPCHTCVIGLKRLGCTV